jgi:molecular chaperone GrpE
MKVDEISSLLQYDGENVIKGFIPILDDLGRMIESSNTADEVLKDGMNMVESKINKFLESLDVKPFGGVGDEMNPEIHDAMMTQKDESKDDHVILSVFENGFTYREKVIRHAKVIVNKR